MKKEPADPAARLVELGSRGNSRDARELQELVSRLRRKTLLEGEAIWLGRLGWRLSRPLFAATLLAIPVFLLQDLVPPAQGLALFAIGAAAFFVLLQLYVQRWVLRVERALERENDEETP